MQGPQTALIVAHGQPSAPERAEAELAALAGQVARHLPEGWRVRAATLAGHGALARAAQGAPGLVYPLFMAGGWFTRVQLPRRLAEAGAEGWAVLEPLGCDPAIHALAQRIVAEAGPAEALLLAAHGSGRSPAPAAVAQGLARRIGAALAIPRAETAFIDQPPRIDQARGFGPGAVCLPFFAAGGEHVLADLPRALAEAGFQGRVLPALGLDARLPGLIAQALRRGEPICARGCRAAE